MPMHKSPSAANNTGSFEKAKLSQNSETQKEAQDESNRYCEKNRRPRQSCNFERNSQNHATAGRRPLTENIDTGYPVLYRAGIGCGEVHREVNLYQEQPLAGGCFIIHIRFSDKEKSMLLERVSSLFYVH